MTTKDYTYLLNKPYSLTERQTRELESILAEFPYLQSARALYLKGLYNKDSFRYNSELKKTAAYTTQRSVLFDFITSEHFRSIQKEYLEEQENAVSSITVQASEIISEENIIEKTTPVPPAEKKEQSVKSIIEASSKPEIKSETGAIPGSPLQFDSAEKHSFAEWLQLSKLKPIDRDIDKEPEAPKSPLEEKLDLIDKFIENNPKIAPVKSSASPSNTITDKGDISGLMTETLARVYVEQKKYTKAIQAYEILILKYPEKSVFFADRISEVKDLQQNNN